MGYPRDLDEYDEKELDAEKRRRAERRNRGLCDYCERAPTSPPCRFPRRHRDPRIGVVDTPSNSPSEV